MDFEDELYLKGLNFGVLNLCGGRKIMVPCRKRYGKKTLKGNQNSVFFVLAKAL